MIAQMTRRLLEQNSVDGTIQTILDDVIALLGAEFGNVQMPIGNELAIVAQRGLSTDFLASFRRVDAQAGTACARALRSGNIVLIPDVAKDPEFAAHRMDAQRAGFRSVQSTPFSTKGGALIAVVSTQFANIHQPTAIELEMLKGYSVIAAEYIDHLLGDVSLADKAEQMSEQLYKERRLADVWPQDRRAQPVPMRALPPGDICQPEQD